MTAAGRTGYLWDTRYSWFDTGTGGFEPADPGRGLQPIGHHVAHPDTKRRFHELVVTSGMIDHVTQLNPQFAQREDILRVHDAAHLDSVLEQGLLPKGGDGGDGFTPFGRGGDQIALLAAGGAMEAVRAVVAGEVDRAYALINPPGHHAERATGRGFCVFNNGAVAAAYALEVLGLDRVAIVDWDVHHGNGAQDIFWEEGRVLNISVHQDRCFPFDSGFREERGAGAGEGRSLNIPLPPGGGNAVYHEAFARVVVPALRDFKPQLIIIASGFDASILDPLSRMMVRAEGFRDIARQMMEIADEVADGRLVAIQEGGYSPFYVPFCGLAVIEEFSGHSTGIEDGYAGLVGNMGGDVLLDHEDAAVEAAASARGH